MKKVQLTKSGLDNLKKELNDLESIKRPKTVDRLKKARAMGDLSENSEYTGAKEELELIEGRILEIKQIIESAEVVESSNQKNTVQIGSSVIVEINGKKERFEVVGEFEANPTEKKLSRSSPIGQALIGKKPGELVEVEVPAGKIQYKIIEIQ